MANSELAAWRRHDVGMYRRLLHKIYHAQRDLRRCDTWRPASMLVAWNDSITSNNKAGGAKPYDGKAAAWKPTMPPYDLHEDEKRLYRQMLDGKNETRELQADGIWTTFKFAQTASGRCRYHALR